MLFSVMTAVWGVLASVASAQSVQYCSPADKTVCYTVNVPDQSASSSSGDIYFQIKGPTSKQWIALGQGQQMAGSNMFVIYSNAAGNNVTLSPRLGKGHVQPKFDSTAQVFLLEGSGIENGVMTANIRCSSCTSWQGGTMDLTSSDSNWIWAIKEGDPLNSDSQSADIEQHNDAEPFQFDLTKARGGSSTNPFVVAGTSTNTTPAPAASGSSSSSDGDSGDSEGGGGEGQKMKRILIAHGTLMGLAFVIVYPLGAIIIRLLSFQGLVWVHAGVQWFAYAMALAGMGLGVYLGTRQEYQLNEYHPVIGLLVLGLLIIQPFLGTAHHIIYKRKGKTSIWTRLHVIWGRLLVTLGIINGGLGLRFSGNTTGGEIAYGIIAGIVWITWMVVAVWGTRRAKKRTMQIDEK